MMENLAWKEVFRVVVLVQRQDFTCKCLNFIWKSINVERETHQVVQTGELEMTNLIYLIFDNTFNKRSDGQVGEFVLHEISNFSSVFSSTDQDGRLIR